MILTITPNTALDRVFILPSLERNRRNQAEDWVESMGGKGCNVSSIVAALGEETVATGVAAGETGRRMEAMLRKQGVTPDLVWTEGETRINTVLIERQHGAHTTICAPALHTDPQALPGLKAWIEKWAPSAAVIVLAGSLPEGWPDETYGELTEVARAAGKPLVVDASGAQLEAALRGPVTAIKPNLNELESVAGPLRGRQAIADAADGLRARGAGWVLVSLGAEGALLVSENGRWEAPGLRVPVVNPAGAGDGMTACLALGLARGWDEAETLRWAVAVSAAVVTTRGTAEFYPEDAQRLLPQVHISRV